MANTKAARTRGSATIHPISTRRAAGDSPARAARSDEGGEVRAAILEAARGLYTQGGYAGVTMRAIATQLGIRAPSLYHHFVSKEEIFLALQERTLQLLQSMMVQPATTDPIEDVRQWYWQYYEFSKVYPDYFALLYVDRSAPALDVAMYQASPFRELRDVGQAMKRRCVDAGLWPANTDIERASAILWSTVHGPAVLRAIHRRDVLNFDLTAAESLDLTLEGIRTGLLAAVAARVQRRRRSNKQRQDEPR